jgi:hypothetical protein
MRRFDREHRRVVQNKPKTRIKWARLDNGIVKRGEKRVI